MVEQCYQLVVVGFVPRDRDRAKQASLRICPRISVKAYVRIIGNEYRGTLSRDLKSRCLLVHDQW